MNVMLGFQMKRTDGRCGPVFLPAIVALVSSSILAAMVLFSSDALAQERDLQPLLDRLERMERDIRTLNVQLSRSGSSSSSAPASATSTSPRSTNAGSPAFVRLEERLSSVEEELRAVAGRGEQLVHQLDQIGLRLDRLVGDVDFRLGVLEKATVMPTVGAGTSPTVTAGVAQADTAAASPQSLGTVSQKDLQGADGASARTIARVATPASLPQRQRPSVLPEGTPRERYGFALSLLRQAHYVKAEEALREFLERHAEDPLVDNARYWLGETYYVRGDYALAAEIFLQGFQKSPNSSKAPDTLLKLGMALANLDKNREACAAFGKLLADFPEAPESIKSTVALQRKRSECQ